MVDNLEDAITHEREVAKEKKKDADYLDAPYGMDTSARTACLECAADHERLAAWLTELQERREAVKKLEESADNYKDSLFGDGIRFALKVIGEPRKRDWERENK